MKILRYELMPRDEFLGKLRQVRLKGFDRPYIYRDASLEFLGLADTGLLTPPQRYVLNDTVQTIIELDKAFTPLGVDIFDLHGALIFWPEGSDPEKDPPIPFLPPIVEESYEPTGSIPVLLINDGMHRVWAARKLDRCITVVVAMNVPREYPYYAYAWPGGMKSVEELDELPDVYQKKNYRNPDNYKALFRQFNEVFPGVQAQRKQSNPVHIKE
jgi:hypothetical protein